jgi:hypothetical protein
MRNKKFVLAALAGLVAAAVALPLALVSSGQAKSQASTRQIYMTAVEWKGSANISKEPYPTQKLPAGGGYESFAPGHEEVKATAGLWAIETYRFDTAMVAAYVGERVVLNIFGVNAAEHEIIVPAFNKRFTVKRGMLSTVALGVMKKPGIYTMICLTHQPSHRADILVLPKP